MPCEVLQGEVDDGGLDGHVVAALRAHFRRINSLRRKEQTAWASKQMTLADLMREGSSGHGASRRLKALALAGAWQHRDRETGECSTTEADDSAAGDRRQSERRRRRPAFVLRERRTGFEGRRLAVAGPVAGSLEHTLMWLRDTPGTLAVFLITVNILNLADFTLTSNALALGGYEVNPVMRVLFASDPILALLVKSALIALATLLVWRFRRFAAHSDNGHADGGCLHGGLLLSHLRADGPELAGC